MPSFKDKVWLKISGILPRKLAYWCAIRVWCHATVGRWENTDVISLTVLEALDRWHMDNDNEHNN